ncbi:MAG: xanthine dehydrogenase accessory protein XdhC [Rhodobacteraceae bacterium]|nr:xanthine dehydrogenase accessory protein XdhC [Paracoccaceae bacterium]
MSLDLEALRAAVAREGRVARVVVAEAKGSAPREAGAAMLVWPGGQEGTIGGGALEWQATARARALLDRAAQVAGARVDRQALGPDLQQCCGGAVTLVTEVFDADALDRLAPAAGLVARRVAGGAEAGTSDGGMSDGAEMPLAVRRRLRAARGEGARGATALIEGWLVEPLAAPARQVWIWGAGHVGRALVAVLAPLPELSLTWIDTAAERFPAAVPPGVETVVAADPAALVPFAPPRAEHFVLTYSHALDLALCHALLGRGFARCGLIGSATKRARFRRRLAELGHAPEAIARIDCPIGDPALGKHPQAIAISVAAALLAAGRRSAGAREGAA